MTGSAAGWLYDLSKALDVPVALFFEGISGTDDKAQTPKRTKAGQQR